MCNGNDCQVQRRSRIFEVSFDIRKTFKSSTKTEASISNAQNEIEDPRLELANSKRFQFVRLAS